MNVSSQNITNGIQNEPGLTAEPQPLQSGLRDLAETESAGAWLKSAYMEALIERSIHAAVQRAHSPWLDRAGAAAHCRCSVSEIDRAAGCNVFPTYHRAGTPLFKRQDLDAAIAKGLWHRRQNKPTTTERTT